MRNFVAVLAIIFITLITTSARGQEYHQQHAVNGYDNFSSSLSDLSALTSGRSEQYERAAIIPLLSLGTYPYVYPTNTVTYTLQWPPYYGQDASCTIAGSGTSLPPHSSVVCGGIEVLTAPIMELRSTKAAAVLLVNSLTTLQKNAGVAIVPTLEAAPQQMVLYWQHGIACQ